jgi:circadian clock protein KaiB
MAKSPNILRIYVAGEIGRSRGFVERIKTAFDKEMPGQYRYEVVDVSKNPKMVRKHDLVALPTVIRTLPAPMRKFVGNLTDENGEIVGLDLITKVVVQSAPGEPGKKARKTSHG